MVKKARSSEKFVFRRREPHLPKELAAPDAAKLFAGNDISFAEHAVEGVSAEGLTAGSLRIEGSALQRVNFANGRIASIFLKDVRLVNCNLANLETRGMRLIRVEFVSCRMTGLRM